MKKKLIIFAISYIIIFTLLSAALPAQDLAKIVILHTNDMHGHIFPYENPKIAEPPARTGGFAYLATLVKEERAKNPGKVLLLDAGDLAQGTIYSNLSYGIPVIDLMSYLRYDASIIGNHEFDWGEEKLVKMIFSADFPFLTANLVKKNTGNFIDGIKPYTVKNINGIRLGIIGICCTDTSVLGPSSGVDSYDFLSPAETLKTYIPILKFIHKADLIVVLSHEGYEKDLILAEKVPDIDIIVGSHSHTLLEEPVLKGETVIVQAGSYMTHLGRLEIEFDRDKKEIVSYEGKVIKITDSEIEPDPEVEWMVNNYKEKYSSIAQEEIGEASIDMMRSLTRECNIGNLTADILKEAGKAEIGLINSEGIRQDILKGPVTMEEIYSVFPFDNILVTIELTGKDLKDLLEVSFSGEHSILQVSGLYAKYDLSGPPGNRLVELKVGGRPLEEDKFYKIATVDFLAGGGDGYEAFENGKNLENITLARDAIVNYFKEKSPLFCEIEGRIEVIE